MVVLMVIPEEQGLVADVIGPFDSLDTALYYVAQFAHLRAAHARGLVQVARALPPLPLLKLS